MSKIKVFIFTLLMTTCSVALAADPVPLTCEGDHENSVGHGHPKMPICPPELYIEDYTLLFAEGHPDYVLNIKDEDGDVVYTTTVYETMTQVVLPSTLSGDYEVELIMGNWIFTGWINL